jgi:hypothetical protein
MCFIWTICNWSLLNFSPFPFFERKHETPCSWRYMCTNGWHLPRTVISVLYTSHKNSKHLRWYYSGEWWLNNQESKHISSSLAFVSEPLILRAMKRRLEEHLFHKHWRIVKCVCTFLQKDGKETTRFIQRHMYWWHCNTTAYEYMT